LESTGNDSLFKNKPKIQMFIEFIKIDFVFDPFSTGNGSFNGKKGKREQFSQIDFFGAFF
jgi:hypothetical protein